MDLSVITVTYQSEAVIDSLILSVATHIYRSQYEHIIIDNGSSDGTTELVEFGYLNYVHLVKNKQNLGFAIANNLGVKHSKGKYLLFLNPDMQIASGNLDDLIAWMDNNPDVGVVGCRLVSEDGRPHVALRPFKYPSLFPYFQALIGAIPFFCTTHSDFLYEGFQDDEIQDVEVMRGAFLMVRRDIAVQLGFAFDPRYFLLLEDVDLCREVKKLGYRVVYNPMIKCIDHFGRSFAQKPKLWKYLVFHKSLRIYVSKWHSRWHLVWLLALLPLGACIRTLTIWKNQTYDPK